MGGREQWKHVWKVWRGTLCKWSEVWCSGMGEKKNRISLASFTQVHTRHSHMERRKSEEFVKEVYNSETEGPTKKGRPVVWWKDSVKEYIYWRVADKGRGIELGRECVDRERWKLFCLVHPLWEKLLERTKRQRL